MGNGPGILKWSTLQKEDMRRTESLKPPFSDEQRSTPQVELRNELLRLLQRKIKLFKVKSAQK